MYSSVINLLKPRQHTQGVGFVMSCAPFLKASVFLIAALLTSFLPAFAEYIPPGEVEIKTKRYEVKDLRFTPAKYQYKVAWQGIPVASAEIDVTRADQDQGEFYQVQALAQTKSIIAMLYRLRHVSQSIFRADTFQPISFESRQQERSKDKLRAVEFDKDGLIRVTAANLKKQEKEEVMEFRSENQTLDPISAAFVARTLPIEIGTEAAFDVFNGKHRYLITMKVDSREKITIGDKEYDTFKVIPNIKRLTETENDKRLESCAIWISADDKRDVLKLESKVFVGRVTAVLEKMEEVPENSSPVLQTASIRTRLKSLVK